MSWYAAIMKSNKIIKFIIRAVSLFLVVLMIIGFVFVILPVGGTDAATYSDDINIRVGISYGSSVTKSYKISSPAGFEIGYCVGGKNFKARFMTGATDICIARDGNLLYSNGEYLLTDSASVTVGGYHLEFPIDTEAASFEGLFNDISDAVKELGLTCFRACINKCMLVRAGNFATYEAASAALSKVNSLGKFYCRIASPSSSAITFINYSNNAILYEFDQGGTLTPAIKATDGYYISAPNGYSYDGSLSFSVYSDGISVINVLPLETYIQGVLPYEISSSWNIETQKAFACCVRSYTLASLCKHEKQYGFDLCNTTDCQVYRGVNSVNDMVRSAVASTRNMVLSYNSDIVCAYYSSSTGGTTASAYDVWGGTSFPYLGAVATPWEKYESHSSGSWSVEISPSELYNTLKSKGYSGLKGNIASVKINSLAENSTYVKSITFTDIYNNSVTISKCDKIRIALSKYLKSANFVVAKGGSSVSITDYKINVDYSAKHSVNGFEVMTLTGKKVQKQGSTFYLKGASSNTPYTNYSGLKVITSESYVPLSAETYSAFPDLSKAVASKTNKTVTAPGSSDNFVFIGRGYGHGVGMSQYGAKDLGDIGYTYDDIIKAYFPKIEILNMNNITCD